VIGARLGHGGEIGAEESGTQFRDLSLTVTLFPVHYTITAEVGISKRTLYNHFPSKDAHLSASRRKKANLRERQVRT
jgi:hypothetical protein